ncbi:MAG: hypothetical protein KGL39_16665 [Patescibacteria group bacterium]|nr:hypothetical protein [Patescibacteria group bacterium]
MTHWVFCLLAVYVAAESYFRINVLDPSLHSRLWSLMYMVYGATAAMAIWLLVVTDMPPEFEYVLYGALAAMALNTALTHDQWKLNQAAKIARKGEFA